MRIVAGVDIGSTASKALILEGEQVRSWVVGPSSVNPAQTAQDVFDQALGSAQLEPGDVTTIVGTGYGRAKVSFAHLDKSELSCHARGAHFLLASVRTVFDIGGQDTKILSLDRHGNLVDYAMNEKCAAGTGRFLEAMARSVGVKLDRFADLHFGEGQPVTVTSMCSVFAESEIISLVNEGVELPCLVKGIHLSLARRVATLAQRQGIEQDLVVSGGVAKNRGVLAAIEQVVGAPVRRFPNGFDPQLVGALGAALFARELGDRSTEA